MWKSLAQLLRAGLAGGAATGADLLTLAALVHFAHLEPRLASVPALVVGGVVNFVGNRTFAFRAARGDLGKQVAGYTAVEVAALGLHGLLYDLVLRVVPGARAAYVLVRLVTSHVVFLGWSYPLWRRVFAPPRQPA